MPRLPAARDPMLKNRGLRGAWAWLGVLPCLALAPLTRPAEVHNPTGVPLYPNLIIAVLDNVLRTDELGHWCMHLSARSSDSLDAVERWYRGALARTSETDLTHDAVYAGIANLDGIKLARDVDSVAVYKVAGQPVTFIDIARCSPVR
jgi:hypothetical protein